MDKRKLSISILVITFMIMGCKDKVAQVESSQPQAETIEFVYPVLPVQQQAYLFENVESIDYIFQDLPYSISQSEKPSIQAKIAGISQSGVPPNDCIPMARMFFQIKGEILFEADVYFSPPDCHYYVFIEDGKAVYASQMGATNINFYTQFLNQMNVSQ